MDRQDETRRLADKQTDRCRDISVLSRWKYLLCYVGAIHMLRQETEAYIMCWTLMCRNLIRWVSKDAKCSRYTVNISSVRFSRGYKVKIHLRKWFGKIWLNNDHLELLDKELNNKNPTIWQMWWKPLQEYVTYQLMRSIYVYCDIQHVDHDVEWGGFIVVLVTETTCVL